MYSEILVPLDGSELAEAALPHARRLAKAFEARVTLISIVESVTMFTQPSMMGAVPALTNLDEEMESVRKYLEKIADQLKLEGIDVLKIVREGDAAAQICDYAKESRADLVVMSTHGRSGLQRWVYGSVADRVLRSAEVPVLLVRAQAAQ